MPWEEARYRMTTYTSGTYSDCSVISDTCTISAIVCLYDIKLWKIFFFLMCLENTQHHELYWNLSNLSLLCHHQEFYTEAITIFLCLMFSHFSFPSLRHSEFLKPFHPLSHIPAPLSPHMQWNMLHFNNFQFL